MKKLLPFIFLFIISCNHSNTDSSADSFNKMKWIIGDWENVSDESQYYETWKRSNDSTYTGKSYLIANNDTLYTELLKVEILKNECYYIPQVSNQNEGKAIKFKLVSANNGKFVFENKLHDFPQRIIYMHPSQDSLISWIEGEKDGKFNKVEFPMIRKK
ncbi:DUF6265 family protein [Bacteroidota bacterium]